LARGVGSTVADAAFGLQDESASLGRGDTRG